MLTRFTALLAFLPLSVGWAQAPASPSPGAEVLKVQSSLVLVPALVKDSKGELVFTLAADDFTLLDDGVPQRIHLETDTDSQPLALVVLAQTGGLGASHLREYGDLHATLEAIIGAVQHRVAVVSFDSSAHLEQPFTSNTDAAASVLGQLEPGDEKSAILDGLEYAIQQLAKQPATYRRAIVMLTETADNGSETTLDQALRDIDDTNTAIYSFAFSSTKAALKHEGAKLPVPNRQTVYSSTPYAAGGCMSREPGADPDAHGHRSVQALDCASDLLPPLRLARMAFLAAKDSIRSNVPETVARLTGGEYFTFKDRRSLSRDLVTIMNDVPNHYVLSFVPQSPHPGLHALDLQLKNRPDLNLKHRTAYWFAPATP